MVVLIDNGATHNFISNVIVHEWDLPLTDIGGSGVVLGTRLVEQSRGLYCGLILTVQGVQVTKDFLPLDLGSTNIILGMQWLHTLGETRINRKLLRLQYEVEGRWVVLDGNRSYAEPRCP